jgi:hypothetical protein
VAVDPPPHAHVRALADQLPGDGWTHLAWGGAELELARRVLTWELDLRAQLADVYRALRAPGSHATVSGDELARILHGPGAQPRSGAVAGRLLRVLWELNLVAVATDPLCVTVPPVAGRTELERSRAFRAYSERHRAGLAHLGATDGMPEPARAAAAA